MAQLLAAYPTVTAVVFDQPHVVANLEPVLAAGPLADRCTVVGGDFFAGVPAGADAYVLKSVIHDWPDAESIEILAACRAAGGDGSTVLLVERALAGPNEGADNKFSYRVRGADADFKIEGRLKLWHYNDDPELALHLTEYRDSASGRIVETDANIDAFTREIVWGVEMLNNNMPCDPSKDVWSYY